VTFYDFLRSTDIFHTCWFIIIFLADRPLAVLTQKNHTVTKVHDINIARGHMSLKRWLRNFSE
jgi:hypothetical protein